MLADLTDFSRGVTLAGRRNTKKRTNTHKKLHWSMSQQQAGRHNLRH